MADREAQALATLDTLLALARDVAEKLQSLGDPGHAELLAALTTAQLCALRLLAERNAVRAKRPAKITRA